MRNDKPLPGALIDSSHPLARGLFNAVVFNEASGVPSDTITRLTGLPSATPPAWRGSNPFGVSLRFNTGSTHYIDILGKVRNGGTITELTEVLGLVHVQTNNSFDHRVIENADSDNSGKALIYESGTAGRWRWQTPQAGVIGQFTLNGVPDGYIQHALVLDGKISSSLSTGLGSWYVNGLKKTPNLDTNSTGAINDYNRRLGGIAAAARSLDGFMHFYYKFSRALTAEEVAQLWIDPFCMFKQPVKVGRKIFSITAGPTLSNVSPSSGAQGATNLILSFTGTGFNVGFSGGDPHVVFSGTGITVNDVTVNSSTDMDVDITIGISATISTRTVTVQTDNGTSGSQNFGVTTSLVPTLTSVTPNDGYGHEDIPIAFFDLVVVGTHMDGANPIFNPPVGWQIGYNSPGTATLWTIYIITPIDPTPGDYTFTFETDDGESNPLTFTILDPASSVVGSGASMRGGFIN